MPLDIRPRISMVLRSWLAAGFLVSNGFAVSAPSSSTHDAVILMYHNISDTTPPSTSVSPKTFAAHMQYLADNGYTVWPLMRTLEQLAEGQRIPEKTVVITFDDAYRTVYTEAFPVLKSRGWPFTVFVTTQYVDSRYGVYMDWNQLRELQRHGGDIGNHSRTHAHLVRRQSGETPAEWRARVRDEIEGAQRDLQKHVGEPVAAFAYPYGEHSEPLRAIVRDLGLFGLGQHSGAVGALTDMQIIPRYPMAVGYDAIDEFAIKLSSRALPVSKTSPRDGILSGDVQIPELTLHLHDGDYSKDSLACYASGQGRINVEWVDGDRGIVRVKANRPLSPGRSRYNCTARSRIVADSYFWYSWLWLKPNPDGSWYRE